MANGMFTRAAIGALLLAASTGFAAAEGFVVVGDPVTTTVQEADLTIKAQSKNGHYYEVTSQETSDPVSSDASWYDSDTLQKTETVTTTTTYTRYNKNGKVATDDSGDPVTQTEITETTTTLQKDVKGQTNNSNSNNVGQKKPNK